MGVGVDREVGEVWAEGGSSKGVGSMRKLRNDA